MIQHIVFLSESGSSGAEESGDVREIVHVADQYDVSCRLGF